MENNYLTHHGIKGQKWGVRRYQTRDGKLTAAGKKRYDKDVETLKKEKADLDNKLKTINAEKKAQAKVEKLAKEVEEKRKAVSENSTKPKIEKKTDKSKTDEKPKQKSVKEMSDDEIREQIARMRLEDEYRTYMSKLNPAKKNKGKEFVLDVLEKSGKNIATQAATYAMGKAVNAALKDVFNDDSVVNPKKGQKDK